jgi:hypothetical protein
MPRSEFEITALVRDNPPTQSVPILQEWLLDADREIAEATAARQRIAAMLTKVGALVGNAEDAIILSETAPADHQPTLRMMVFSVLKKARERPIDRGTPISQIVEAINATGWVPPVSYQMIRNVLHAGNKSMIACGEAVVIEQPPGSGRGTLYRVGKMAETTDIEQYVSMILEAHAVAKPSEPLTPDNPIVREFAESIGVYTEKVIWPRNGGRRLQAGHTFKAIRNHGLLGAIEVMVEGPTTSGFDGLHQIGRGDLAVEYIVIRNAEDFEDKTVAKARERLVAQGAPISDEAINPETGETDE